jgi:hypothetical protein|tara:strand:+ start:411 stop:758 length:348 start_codon:yes stop_codon:yes gene_type:complete
MTKKRTINELRQVKTYGYTSSSQETTNRESVTIEKIKSLVSVTPNDTELGEKIRKLFFVNSSIDSPQDTNIFGKIPGGSYKDLIESYQTKKGDEFNDWYGGLTKEEKIFITSMFD